MSLSVLPSKFRAKEANRVTTVSPCASATAPLLILGLTPTAFNRSFQGPQYHLCARGSLRTTNMTNSIDVSFVIAGSVPEVSKGTDKGYAALVAAQAEALQS